MTDLEELEKRFKLLEGENKLSTDKLTGELKANKDLIRRMNEENRHLRQQVANGADEIGEPRNKVVSSLLELKSRINILSDENKKKEKIVMDLQAKISLTERGVVNDDNSAQARQIRVLENRIDKAMIKLNEAQSIKKTYESILDRLKDERIGFDNTLVDLETQLKAKQKDYDELVLLLRDATHAKEIAHAELHRFEQAVMEERNQRDREVMEKRLLVQKRIDMNRTLEENRKSKVLLDSQAPAETVSPQDTSDSRVPQVHHQHKPSHKHDHYEEAYSKLKEVTGCSDVNEIIQKFVSQDETQRDLERQVADQEANLQNLNREYSSVSRQLDDLKFAGNGMLTNRKQALEDIEKHLNESVTKLEQNRAKYEKLARIMIDIHSGVNHLVTKLAEIKVDDSDSRMYDAVEVNDDTIEEILNQCEVKVQKLTQVCAHIPEPDDSGVLATRADSDVRVRLSSSDLFGLHLEDLEDDDENFFALRKSIPNGHKEKHRVKTTKFAK